MNYNTVVSKIKTQASLALQLVRDNFVSIGADVIAWAGLVLINVATVPTFVAILTGLTEKMPPVDLILFIWAGMLMFFVKAAINKELLNVITIGIGFLLQASLLALIIFK